MTSKLKNLTSRIFKVGTTRIKINPELKCDKQEEPYTRNKVRKLVKEKQILIIPSKGVTRRNESKIPRETEKEIRIKRVRLLRKILIERKPILGTFNWKKIYLKISNGSILTKKQLFYRIKNIEDERR